MIRQYFAAKSAEDFISMLVAMQCMNDADKLRVYLSCGVGGPGQYGFGAEVGRA